MYFPVIQASLLPPVQYRTGLNVFLCSGLPVLTVGFILKFSGEFFDY